MKAFDTAWLSAENAIALLGVNRATLYAYVSRGRIRSEPVPGSARRRRYSKDDIDRLLARTRERRDPAKAAEQAMHWGLPVLESSITLIADGRAFYRGHDAQTLAQDRSLAEVAALIWTGTLDATLVEGPARPFVPAPGPLRGPFIARAQAALALAAAEDALAFDLRPASVAQTGWHIMQLLARVATGEHMRDATIDAGLAAAWDVTADTDLIRATLVLCADHELNVSAFTARCVASAGTAPYGVVVAGLAALEGFRHGGTTARIEALWDALGDESNLERALAARLQRGERIDGFGHPLYPDGDPRARMLLERLPDSAAAERARQIANAARAVLGETPTLDYALVALARGLGLRDGTALTLFAIGRTIGWIGQAIEQYAAETMIRPRAKYVGEVPPADG